MEEISMMVSPVRQPPLGEQLLDQLRGLIVRGELTAGTHLVEGWMAERFGVSRGPVRDALRQLEIEGLVETRKRGVFVHGLTDTDLVELYAVRGALEGLAVTEAIARLAAADWSPLDTAVAEMHAAADDGDPDRFGAADLDFHSGFYTIAANRRLAATWALHRPLFAAMLAVTNTDRELAPVARDHADLSATIRAGEVGPALAALAEHLDGSCARMRSFMATRVRTSSAS